MTKDTSHICPVCGKTMFSEYDSYEICNFCGWEDEAMQEEEPDLHGGFANRDSLNQCREKYRKKIAENPNYSWAKECDEERDKKGIFWIVDRENLENNEPFLFRIPVDIVGKLCCLTEIPPFYSKYGDNYNYRKTWESYVPAEVRQGKPYNYYPRGRVEIKEMFKAKIFLNPDIADEKIIAYIVEKFRLERRDVKVIATKSKRYSYTQNAEEEQ